MRTAFSGEPKASSSSERPLAEQVEFQRRVRPLHAQIEQPPQVVAAIGLAEHAVERLHGEVVGLVFFDEEPIRLHGLVHATHVAGVDLGELGAKNAQLFPDARSAAPSESFFFLLFLPARVGFERLEPRGEGFDEARPLIGGARRRFERRDRAFACGSELVGLAGPPERRGAILQSQPGHLHELVEQGELLFGVAAVSEQDLVERRQATPLLVLLVERSEGGRCARVVGSHRENALVRPERALRGVQPLGVDAGGAEAQVDLEVGGGRRVGGARDDLDERFPVVVLGVELGQAFVVADGQVAVAQDAQGLGVRGLELEDAVARRTPSPWPDRGRDPSRSSRA